MLLLGNDDRSMLIIRTLAIVAIIVGSLTLAAGVLGAAGVSKDLQRTCSQQIDGALGAPENSHLVARAASVSTAAMCRHGGFAVSPKYRAVTGVVFGAVGLLAAGIATLLLDRAFSRRAS